MNHTPEPIIVPTEPVGSPTTVRDRIEEYRSLGIDTVVASGFPHLEEAYRVSELLFPLLDLSTGPASRPRNPAAIFAGGGALSASAAEFARS